MIFDEEEEKEEVKLVEFEKFDFIRNFFRKRKKEKKKKKYRDRKLFDFDSLDFESDIGKRVRYILKDSKVVKKKKKKKKYKKKYKE